MYERDSKEKILQRMVNWSRSVSPKLTDFRRGSVIRTIYEAVALVVEGGYSKFYTALKSLIERNIYAVVGFDKIEAKPSTGLVTFGRSTPATTAIFIPLGTEVVAKETDYRPPITFRTTMDGIIDVGYTAAIVPVVCTESGILTNILAGDIVDFVSKPVGVDTVTNTADFIDGRDEETPEEQKNRFTDYMDANTRGTLQSIEFGASQAYVTDVNGLIEQAVSAKALEYLPDRKGEVDLYIWNGVGSPSEALKTEIQKVLLGYYDDNGDRVYGYKNGGTQVNIYPASTSSVRIKLTLTLQGWASETYVKDRIQKEIEAFFRRLSIGQTLLYSEILARVKVIEGVFDVKVELSNNAGASYSSANVTVSTSTINVLESIVYA
jgi:uncharacterized phage protein gp47/JayE